MKAIKLRQRYFSVALVIIAGVAASFMSWGPGAAPRAAEPDTDLSTFMRKKLASSSKILEGLTVDDVELIRQGAAEILEMSKVEKWNVLTDADYREFNRDFRSTMCKLEEAAANQKLDGAMLQWIDAMKGCVECHQYVRSQRVQLKKN